MCTTDDQGMTTASISHRTDAARRWSVVADLAFWTAAGAVATVASTPLAHAWGVPRAVLLGTGITFVTLGPVLLLGLRRIRVTRGLVAGFVATNAVLTPLAWAAAEYGWLRLTHAGNEALVGAGVVMLALGAWQTLSLRRG